MTEQELIELILDYGVLTVKPAIQLKSGVMSDHFYNFGMVSSAETLSHIACHMIANIYGDSYTTIFTSAYTGIMLASALLFECGNFYPNIKFNIGYLRKERKDHGEQGIVVGHCPKPGDVAVLVDDVFTSGQSLVEMAEFVKATGATIESAIVVVRRASPKVQAEIEEKIGCPIRCLVSDEAVMAKYARRCRGKA